MKALQVAAGGIVLFLVLSHSACALETKVVEVASTDADLRAKKVNFTQGKATCRVDVKPKQPDKEKLSNAHVNGGATLGMMTWKVTEDKPDLARFEGAHTIFNDENLDEVWTWVELEGTITPIAPGGGGEAPKYLVTASLAWVFIANFAVKFDDDTDQTSTELRSNGKAKAPRGTLTLTYTRMTENIFGQISPCPGDWADSRSHAWQQIPKRIELAAAYTDPNGSKATATRIWNDNRPPPPDDPF
jgi:hypothetical protein